MICPTPEGEREDEVTSSDISKSSEHSPRTQCFESPGNAGFLGGVGGEVGLRSCGGNRGFRRELWEGAIAA